MGEDHGYIDRNSCLAVTHYWCTYLFGYPSIQQSEFGTNEYRKCPEALPKELTHKIDQLEEEVQKTAKTYQEEVLVYQGKLATAQSERDFLRAENQVLKELQRVNQMPGTREEKQHSAVG